MLLPVKVGLFRQVKTENKSNEITAIPELLKLLEIKGCIITIDAMGCQRAIAEQIINQKGDNGSQNFATLRRLALNLLKLDTSIKKSIKRKRFLAAMDTSYLEKILNSNDF